MIFFCACMYMSLHIYADVSAQRGQKSTPRWQEGGKCCLYWGQVKERALSFQGCNGKEVFARQLAFSAVVTLGNLISLYPDFLVPKNGHENKI